MFTSLYAKLIASGVVVLLVAAAYFYVTGLQHKVTQLNRDNATLEQSVGELKGTISAQKEFQTVVEKVIASGDKVKEQNRTQRDNQLKKIDEKVRAGQDKPVGPLLRDYLNDK